MRTNNIQIIQMKKCKRDIRQRKHEKKLLVCTCFLSSVDSDGINAPGQSDRMDRLLMDSSTRPWHDCCGLRGGVFLFDSQLCYWQVKLCFVVEWEIFVLSWSAQNIYKIKR